MKNAALKCMIKALKHYALHQLKPPHYMNQEGKTERNRTYSSLVPFFTNSSSRVSIVRLKSSGGINLDTLIMKNSHLPKTKRLKSGKNAFTRN